MLSRNKVYQKEQPHLDARKIYIFCEGDREVNYFKFFEGFSSNISIIPVPSERGHTDPEKLMNSAITSFYDSDGKPRYHFDDEMGDEVWFAIDTDQWNNGNKIAKLRDYCSGKSKWSVAQSNPCFEIWLYYHFYNLRPDEVEVSRYAHIKHFVGEKIAGGFDSRKHPLYLQEGIQNAESNFTIENGQPCVFSTEVFRLGQSILPFIKESLDKII